MTIRRGIGAVCSACGYVNDDAWRLHTHVLWANGYGTAIRYFCGKCGQVEDRTYTGDELTATQVQPWMARGREGDKDDA